MMMRLFLVFAFLVNTYLHLGAQVTIGSGRKPTSGSLMQLKENEGTSDNATRGLGMPRVMLTDVNNLYPMFVPDGSGGYTGVVKVDEDSKHTGLMVYHIDKCTMNGTGMYVWNGTEWQKLGTNSLPGMDLSSQLFHLPSGQDIRPLAAQTLTINWLGAVIPTWSSAASGGLASVPFSGTPLLPLVLSTSPTDMSLLPDAMSTTEVTATEPWVSKETTLTFNHPECAQAKNIVLNQTNYALQVNGKFGSSRIAFYNIPLTPNFSVKGNARWIVSKSDPENLLSVSTPAIGTTNGTDLTNNTTSNITFNYTIAAVSKYQAALVTFKDATTPIRFNDIRVNIVNCNPASEPTLEQWKDKVVAANGGTLLQDVTNGVNGVAWHKDQDSNFFLSGKFGTAGRWMLNNMSAINYDTDVTSPPPLTNSLNNGAIFTDAFWAYPNSVSSNPADDSKYILFRRLGRIYNYAAATGNQNPSTANQGGIIHTLVQGICPNGWHLPTDREWTDLENVIIASTSQYSITPDIGGAGLPYTGSDPSTSEERGIHGVPMKDVCESFALNGAHEGTSKTLVDGGFSILFAGHGISGQATNIGGLAYFWSGSSQNSFNAHARNAGFQSDFVSRNKFTHRNALNSVRCKKNIDD